MKLWLLILMLAFSLGSISQKRLQYDTASIEKRAFSNSAIQKFKNSDEFNYENIKEPPKSLWQRFWASVWHWITDMLSTKEGRTTAWVIFIVISVSILTAFIIRLIGMNSETLFTRGNSEGLAYSVTSDDIHNISFDEAIEDAISAGDYRLAVRLLYLQCLKRLSDKGLIDWKSNKTNTEYLKEVSQQKWAPLFSNLTYNFDYTWYGEMVVTKEAFNAVKEDFKTFNNQLS